MRQINIRNKKRYSVNITNYIKSLTEQISELKRDLSNELNKSCENCIKGKKCKTLHYVYKNRLKNEGYAMHKCEFSCKHWECSF